MADSSDDVVVITDAALPPGRREVGFGLWPVVLVIVLCAAGMAFAFRSDSDLAMPAAIAAIVVIAVTLGVYSRSVSTVGIFLLLITAGFCLLPIGTLPHGREPARAMQCMNNVKMITMALSNYHFEYGSLPPAYIADEEGNPQHSWRVLILPFIEQQALYNEYRFEESWDSQHNLQVAARMPDIYRCPTSSSPGDASLITPYVAVIGPDTAWPGKESTTIVDFPDGLVHTGLIVEWPESRILWTDPRDLSIDALALLAHPAPERRHRHAAIHVGYITGHVSRLPLEDMHSGILRRLFQRSDGPP